MSDTEASAPPTTTLTKPVTITRNETPSDAATTTTQTAPEGDDVPKLGSSPPMLSVSPKKDRRLSKEWDAARVPPSRFQKKEGSIYATPGSRDGHVDRNAQPAYHEKLKEKKWNLFGI